MLMCALEEKISKIAIEVGLHILYGVAHARNNIKWLMIYGGVNIVLFTFFLIMITYFTCRKRKVKSQLSLQENTTANQTYVSYSTVDSDLQNRERMSQYSVNTDFEFSYFDPIKNNNRPSSDVATMKLLQTP